MTRTQSSAPQESSSVGWQLFLRITLWAVFAAEALVVSALGIWYAALMIGAPWAGSPGVILGLAVVALGAVFVLWKVVAAAVRRRSRFRRRTQRADVAEAVLLCLAMTVAALATFAILVASTVFADYIGLWMPAILSRQMMWAVGVGWLVSLVGMGLMGRRPWLRRLGTGLIAAYLVMLAMLALRFIEVISSPTYTL